MAGHPRLFRLNYLPLKNRQLVRRHTRAYRAVQAFVPLERNRQLVSKTRNGKQFGHVPTSSRIFSLSYRAHHSSSLANGDDMNGDIWIYGPNNISWAKRHGMEFDDVWSIGRPGDTPVIARDVPFVDVIRLKFVGMNGLVIDDNVDVRRLNKPFPLFWLAELWCGDHLLVRCRQEFSAYLHEHTPTPETP